jgi:hypothetical protein
MIRQCFWTDTGIMFKSEKLKDFGIEICPRTLKPWPAPSIDRPIQHIYWPIEVRKQEPGWFSTVIRGLWTTFSTARRPRVHLKLKWRLPREIVREEDVAAEQAETLRAQAVAEGFDQVATEGVVYKAALAAAVAAVDAVIAVNRYYSSPNGREVHRDVARAAAKSTFLAVQRARGHRTAPAAETVHRAQAAEITAKGDVATAVDEAAARQVAEIAQGVAEAAVEVATAAAGINAHAGDPEIRVDRHVSTAVLPSRARAAVIAAIAAIAGAAAAEAAEHEADAVADAKAAADGADITNTVTADADVTRTAINRAAAAYAIMADIMTAQNPPVNNDTSLPVHPPAVRAAVKDFAAAVAREGTAERLDALSPEYDQLQIWWLWWIAEFLPFFHRKQVYPRRESFSRYSLL